MQNIVQREQYGPWAVVTGASSGIGAEFARQLAAHGVDVVLAARRESLLEELGRELEREYGVAYRTVPVDLSEDGAHETIVAATDDLDVGLLVSNAGTGSPGRFLAAGPAELMATVRLNALSHLHLTHHFGRRLRDRGSGGIVLTGAMGATGGLPFMAADSASKAFVQSLGAALNSEFDGSGVDVTVLVTSPTETPIVPRLGFTDENLPLRPISVEQCVRETLGALRKGRPTVVPGRKFRVLNALVPASLNRRMMGGILQTSNGID